MDCIEENDSYEFGEILLGFRDEYKKNILELEKLKQYVRILDEDIEDLYFDLFSLSFDLDNRPELICTFIEKKNKLQQVLTDCSKKIGLYSYGKNKGKVWKDFNHGYKIDGFYSTDIYEQKDFSKQIDLIMETEFVKNIQSSYLESKPHGLLFTSSEIRLCRNDDNGKLLNSVIYNSRDDQIEFVIYEEKQGVDNIIDNQRIFLDSLYKVKFPKNIFSEYHRSIIDKNGDAKKDLIIEDSIFSSYSIYSFDDSEDKVVLKKVKNNILK